MTRDTIDTDFRPSSRLVATVGNFDGVHLGHLHLIEQVKQEALKRGVKSAVITFSNHPLSVLHPGQEIELLSPMNGEAKHRALLDTGVDHIVRLQFTREMARMTSTEFIGFLHDRYNVDALVMGFNHHMGHDRSALLHNREAVNGVELIVADEYTGAAAPVSSSIIRSLVKQGDVAGAAAKLGRPYSITGTVIDGNKNGRKIGFPTANILPDSSQLMPAPGAYAATVGLQRDASIVSLDGMAGISYRPTITRSGKAALSVEVNIFNFNSEIYGETITVNLIDRIRPERRMSDFEQLRQQLVQDRERAGLILARYKTNRQNINK